MSTFRYNTAKDIDAVIERNAIAVKQWGLEDFLNGLINECAPEAKTRVEELKAKPNGHSTDQEKKFAESAPDVSQKEPESIVSSDEDDEPLTEEEAIHLVKVRAKENQKLPLSERETAEDVFQSFKEGPCAVSDSRLKEIISTHWSKPTAVSKPAPEFPPELASLVKSGHARFKDGDWFVKRCYVCGKFNNDECCGQKTREVLATREGKLTAFGRQAVGLDSIRPPKVQTPEQAEQLLKESTWMSTFSGFDELEDGGLKMYIENFLPEGITIISSLPKEGKTWLALSIVKALTTGRPLFGKSDFKVLEKVPVLYLAAEVGDRSFKHRASKFGITNDKTKFLCRTLTKGMIGLQNADLEAAVRALKPVVILDVLSCFNQSDDEDDAVQNQKLRSMISNLRTQGAPVIIVLHHTTKNFKDKPTKENAVRGSGDILAMCDCVWALMMDDRLLQSGVAEIDVVGWGRDFNPGSMRLALTRKSTGRDLSIFGPGIASIIDETGDLGWVDKQAVQEATREAKKKGDQDLADTLTGMVQADPQVSLRTLAEKTEASVWAISQALESRGWRRGKGRYGAWTCRK